MRLSLPSATLLVALATSPAEAQDVQGPFSVALAAKFSVPTPSGSRIVSLRLGTKDIVELMKEDLGITSPGGKLVQRRPIDDLEAGELWLIVGDAEYLDPEPPIVELPVDLPESFFAELEAVKRRNGVETSITRISNEAFAGGDLATDGLEMTMVGTETLSLRLLVQSGVDLGYLHRSAIADVAGGMLADIPELGGVQPAIIRGTIRLGAEKLVP